MKILSDISLKDVCEVYSGPEGQLWELVMGEQIHIGGIHSSMELAKRAGIRAGLYGTDFCCCTGAGMRFLVKFLNVEKMTGIDATKRMIETGILRNQNEGLSERIDFIHSDVCKSVLPENSVDFVWGEDAWCYVEDKPRMIAEAARIVKPGGIISFTDWIEGACEMNNAEAERFLRFMKFPNILSIADYSKLLAENGFEIQTAEYTDRFAPYCELYIEMLSKQLSYDALKIIGFNMPLMDMLAGEMTFMLNMARSNKIAQGMFIAVKK